MIQKVEDGFTVTFSVFFVGKKASEEYSKWYAPITSEEYSKWYNDNNVDQTMEDISRMTDIFLKEIRQSFERGLFEFENCEWGTTIFLNMNNVARIEVSL